MKLVPLGVFAVVQLLLGQASVDAVEFDPQVQLVDVSGTHQFQPPGVGDLRGPCPALNALANHGFIPHNGIATIDELVNASMNVFGLGYDLAHLASIYGTAMSVSTDLYHMSIGGPAPRGSTPADADVTLLVNPGGLSTTHVAFEHDSSVTRIDKYIAPDGDASTMSLDLFKKLYYRQQGLPADQVDYNLAILNDHRMQRTFDSLHQNPNFFLSPFAGLMHVGATHALIWQCFANRSAEYPEGRLNRETLLSFYGVEWSHHFTGKHLVYTPGWERIPASWYRRALSDPYTALHTSDDLLAAASQHPDLIDKYSMGGNVNGVDTFIVLEADSLTNGVYKRSELRNDHNLVCLGLIAGLLLSPEYLREYYQDYELNVWPTLMMRLPPLFTDLNCKGLDSVEERLLEMYPGYNLSLGRDIW
ncbi:Cloroperoxidase [Mytilinidion resinicola]|uniref:Cloroperoxidase n=1 Tax=Mytilinidion resinicola TaxID=574789 RepID=A0A6A6YS67_9PEZI|nr:Cloroperoxidase [Mytilinidion resinicola]KAF2810894.1 Cloroperoxidase [Mytilinidion resinicola]